MKHIVRGKTIVYVDFKCEADNAEDAKEMAEYEVGALTNFCGCGGIDKLIGVYNKDASIYPSEEIEWTDVEEISE